MVVKLCKMVVNCLNSSGEEKSKKISTNMDEHLGGFPSGNGSNIVFGWVVKSVFVFPTSGSGQQKVPEDYMMFVYQKKGEITTK